MPIAWGTQQKIKAAVMLALLLAAVAAVCSVPGCAGPQRVAEAKATMGVAHGTLVTLDRNLEGLDTDLIELEEAGGGSAALDAIRGAIADTREERARIIEVIDDAAKTVDSSDSGWALLDMGLALAAGFFPPLGIARVLSRRAKATFDEVVEGHEVAYADQRETIEGQQIVFEGVVDAIAEGGGPKNPEKAGAAMRWMDPRVKEAVTARRVENGDKVVAVVKSNEVPT